MANYSLNPNNNNNTWYGNDYLNDIHSLQQEQEQDLRLAEAGYGELNAQANLLEKLAQDVQGKDSVAYKNYMDYVNNLRQHTDVLATQGLNPNVTRNLIQAKNDYSRIISPIEEAMKKREELAKNQAEYLKQHPNAVFEKDAHDIGIDQMIKNPNYVPRQLDLEVVASRAKERFEALKNQATQFVTQAGGLSALTKDPQKLRQFIKVHAPYLYDSKYTTGVDPDEIRRLISGDKSLEKALTAKIAEETFNMYGMNSWNTDYDHWSNEQNAQRRYNMYNQLMDTITGGAGHAIGQTTFEKHFDNVSGELAYKWAYFNWQKEQAKKEEERKAKLAAEQKEKYAKMIMGHTTWNDAEGRADEIKNAIRLKILNQIDSNPYKGMSWSQFNDIIDKLEKKGYTYNADGDNLMFFSKLKDELAADKESRKKQMETNMEYINSTIISAFDQPTQAILKNELDKIKKAYDNGDYYANGDDNIISYYDNYKKEKAKEAGFTYVQGKDGKDGYYINPETNEKMDEDFYNRVIDFESKVHELDEGVTVMDENTSKDMANVVYATITGSMDNSNFKGFALDENTLTTLKGSGFGDDQGEFREYMEKAKEGKLYMNVAPVWHPDLKKYYMKVNFYANKDAAGISKPIESYAVASDAFKIRGEYNGRQSDYAAVYLKNMTDARKKYLKKDATQKQRDEALLAFEQNKLLLFGALNERRTEYAGRREFGTSQEMDSANRENNEAIQTARVKNN